MVLSYVTSSRRRGPLEMRMNVIEAISKEERLTRIMYRVQGIAYCQLKKVVAELVNVGVVIAEKPIGGDSRTKMIYRLTPQGEAVLQNWVNMKDILHP